MFAEPKFLVDFMLGRLARRLRVLGYDAKYVDFSNHKEISLLSLRENRVILTRHLKVSPKKSWKLLYINSNNLDEQIIQVVMALGLKLDSKELFSVCTVCNAAVVEVPKAEVKSFVPEYVYKTQENFSSCPVCKRVYWRGTHYELLLNHLRKIGINI